MSLMNELAKQELERRKAEIEGVQNERYRLELWIGKTTALWDRLTAGIDTRLAVFNKPLDSPIASLRKVSLTQLEIIKNGRTRDTVGHLHLSSHPESLDFKVFFRTGGGESEPFKKATFFLDLSNGGLTIRDAGHPDRAVNEETLADLLVEMTLR